MTVPTTRETADHAELARTLEALAVEASASRNIDGAESMMVSVQTIYDLIVNRNALLSEIAALRGERRNIVSHATMGATDGEGLTVNAVSVEITRLRNAMHASYHARATQAERQRDELLNAWRDDGIDLEDFGRIVARLANQGADQ